jgi:hypothetical protein
MFRERSDDAKSVKNLPETVLIGLGLNVPDTERNRRQPVQPVDLTAEMEGRGIVHLDWDGGGNTSGVQYVIEMQVNDGEFTRVDAVTRRSYLHEDAPTGVRLTYRIRGRRNGQLSQPSNEASVRT